MFEFIWRRYVQKPFRNLSKNLMNNSFQQQNSSFEGTEKKTEKSFKFDSTILSWGIFECFLFHEFLTRAKILIFRKQNFQMCSEMVRLSLQFDRLSDYIYKVSRE